MDTNEKKEEHKEDPNEEPKDTTKEDPKATDKTIESQEIEGKSTIEELNPKPSEDAPEPLMQFKKSKNKRGEKKENYKFWADQPVPQFDKEPPVEFGPIKKDNKVEEERQEPYMLPPGFFWQTVDVTNQSELDRLYEFLKENYVEDDDHMFRFDYSRDFLRWHLTAPHYFKEWLISVVKEIDNKKKIIGFISAIPVDITVKGTRVKMGEVNFLCVNAKYRTHRLAPVLIKEVTRRIHLRDIWQAAYTAGVMLPKPYALCTYYHRNLNVSKLLDIKFTYLSPNLNLARAKGIYKVAKDTTIPGLRPMEAKDVDQVTVLLENYLSQYPVHGHYSKEEVAHWFIPRKEVVYAYVAENNEHKITDFLSFYSLPSSVLKHEVHKKLYACYSFFNVATRVSFKELMKNALILAKRENFDVYNCLNIMENQTVFTDLLFGMGDGTLKYYFYNFACPEIKPNELSLVLM